MDALDLGPHLDAQLGVEVRQRLVEQEQARMHDERARDRDALLLAARELRGIAILVARQLHELQHAPDPLADLGRRPALQLEAEGDVAEHRHVREERVVLEHHAEAALLGRQMVHALAVDPQLAVARRDQAGDDVEGGGFAAAARAEQRHELPAPHRQGEVVEDGLRPEALGDPEPQRVELRLTGA